MENISNYLRIPQTTMTNPLCAQKPSNTSFKFFICSNPFTGKNHISCSTFFLLKEQNEISNVFLTLNFPHRENVDRAYTYNVEEQYNTLYIFLGF